MNLQYMTIAQIFDVSTEEADLIVTSFISNRIYEKIMPNMMKELDLEFEDLKAEYAASIVDELKALYNKLGIQVTGTVQESWVKLVGDAIS